jgi:uncharacterized damage-inducible protein DinB
METGFSKLQFQTLFAYHWHIMAHLVERAAQLGEADYKDNPGYSQGSIHALLFHLLRSDRNWRTALETGQRPTPPRPEDYADLKALQAGFEQEQAAWQALLDKLSADEIESDVSLTNWRGDSMTMPRWRFLQHVILHGMQHHADLAHWLTVKGQSPGNIDFLFFQ